MTAAKRITVAVNADEVAALDRVMTGEGVTLTEAVRRLVGYGDFVYRAIREDGSRVEIHEADGSAREVILL